MNKWTQSFLLHPFFNRFNMTFFLGWISVGLFTELPHVFLSGLAAETIYLIARGVLDRSGKPIFQMRKLPAPAKRRFLKVAQSAGMIQKNFVAADPESKLLNHSLNQAKRLARVFLELLLMDDKLNKYIGAIRENFDQKIAGFLREAQTSTGEMKELAERNQSIYEKRRQKFFEMIEKQKVIRGRLDTIENTLKLLGDTAMGIHEPSEVVTDSQIELLLTNVQDAEDFIGEFRRTVPLMEQQKVR